MGDSALVSTPPARRRSLAGCVPCNPDNPMTNMSLAPSHPARDQPPSSASVRQSAPTSSMGGMVTIRSHRRTVRAVSAPFAHGAVGKRDGGGHVQRLQPGVEFDRHRALGRPGASARAFRRIRVRLAHYAKGTNAVTIGRSHADRHQPPFATVCTTIQMDAAEASPWTGPRIVTAMGSPPACFKGIATPTSRTSEATYRPRRRCLSSPGAAPSRTGAWGRTGQLRTAARPDRAASCRDTAPCRSRAACQRGKRWVLERP